MEPGRRWRRRLLWSMLLLLAFAGGLAAGIWWMQRTQPPVAPVVQLAPAESASVQKRQAQKIATLARAVQVSEVAAHDLRDTLAAKEKEISSLRADLAFYARLVDRGAQDQALTVHEVKFAPVAGSHAWNVTITLIRSARSGDRNQGQVTLAVEGIYHGKLKVLPWNAIASGENASGLNYAFRYFQQLQATVMLPEGFSPNRVHVQVDPTKGPTIEQNLTWSEVLSPLETNDVQQQEDSHQPGKDDNSGTGRDNPR